MLTRSVEDTYSPYRVRNHTYIPPWDEAAIEKTPPESETQDDIESARGWQWYACYILGTFFLNNILLPICDPTRKALLLSQGGAGGAWLRAIPSEPVFELHPLRFQVAIRRRLRFPLPLTRHHCRGNACGRLQDLFGDHPASCPVSGLSYLRSRQIEKIWAGIHREAGARVR